MKDFNLSRFWQTFKWLVLTNKRQLVKISLIMLLVFFTEQLFVILAGQGYRPSVWSSYGSYYEPRMLVVGSAMGFNMATWAVMGLVMCTLVCGSLRSKQQRIMLFTHPASKMEKYVARLVYYLVLIPVLTGLSMMLANLLRIGLDLLIGFPAMGFFTEFIVGCFRLSFELQLFDLIVTFWTISVFVLGGTFFRKVPFFMTVGVLMVLGILIFIIMLTLRNGTLLEWLFSDSLPWIVDALLVLCIIFNMRLSYRLYSRMQVIQNRWFNV